MQVLFSLTKQMKISVFTKKINSDLCKILACFLRRPVYNKEHIIFVLNFKKFYLERF